MNMRLSVVMKSLLGVALATLVTAEATARDTGLKMPIADVLTEYADRLDSDIPLYFGEQSHPSIKRKHGEFVSNKKTNGVGKSDDEACRWVMLSAILSLQERASREGGNAVVNIRSYYKKNEMSSKTEYECHAGNIMAGVALIGDVVTLDK